MPLTRRIPKRGFTRRGRVEFQVVNLRDLARVQGDATPENMKSAGLVSSLRRPVKVLGEGDVGGAVHVTAHAFSASARAKIEAAGGSASAPAPAVAVATVPEGA